jgi:hypothetical protein
MRITPGEGFRPFIEQLGVIIEGRAKVRRKRRMKASNAEVGAARAIELALKSRLKEIGRLLPKPWELDTKGLTVEREHNSADVVARGKIFANYGVPIASAQDVDEPDPEVGYKGRSYGVGVTEASAEFALEIYFYDNDGGESAVCGVLVSNFSPEDGENGANMHPSPGRGGEVEAEAEWKRKKKGFDTSKDLWLLIKEAMGKLEAVMPGYDEIDPWRHK